MTKQIWLTAMVATTMLVGCSEPMPGTTRNIGQVQYAAAFATAQDVMMQHGFEIARADAQTGVIQSRPKAARAADERILGGSPARQRARISLRQEDAQVVAHASVVTQREGSEIYRVQRPGMTETYDSVPNSTPAQDTAATTTEQNEQWRTEGYDHRLERQLLEDLYRSLHTPYQTP
jgi:hypothetical protein